GANWSGQIGDGSAAIECFPVQIGASDWASFAAGGGHTLALKADRTLWAWGSNEEGQLGDGTMTATAQSAPALVGMDRDWASIAAGGHHSVALKMDGTLWSWGWNYYGQLGDSTTTARLAPVRVTMDMDWRSIAAGPNHTVAVKRNGTLWAWG